MSRRLPERPVAGGRPPATRRSFLTPLRTVLLLAFGGSGAFIAWGVVDRGPSQVPILTAGLIVLGLTLSGLALGGAITTYRSARAGLAARAFWVAIGGGLAAFAAAILFAAAAVLALVWRSA